MLFRISSVKGQFFSGKIRPKGNNFVFGFVFNFDGSCRDSKVSPPRSASPIRLISAH